jgi:predicted lipid-binding transport protein (Tim44 family)
MDSNSDASDEITPDQRAWMDEQAEEVRKAWADRDAAEIKRQKAHNDYVNAWIGVLIAFLVALGVAFAVADRRHVFRTLPERPQVHVLAAPVTDEAPSPDASMPSAPAQDAPGAADTNPRASEQPDRQNVSAAAADAPAIGLPATEIVQPELTPASKHHPRHHHRHYILPRLITDGPSPLAKPRPLVRYHLGACACELSLPPPLPLP